MKNKIYKTYKPTVRNRITLQIDTYEIEPIFDSFKLVKYRYFKGT